MKLKLLFLFLYFTLHFSEAQMNSNFEYVIAKGDKLFNEGKYLSSIQEFKTAISFLEELDTINKIESYYKIGDAFQNATSTDSAVIYYQKGDRLLNKSTPEFIRSKYFHNKASMNFAQAKIDSAMHYAIKALDLTNSKTNKKHRSLLLSNLGNIFLSKKVFSKAREYLNQSLVLSNESKDSIYIAESLLYLGQLDFEEKKYIESKKKLKQSLSVFEKHQFNKEILVSKTLLSKLYFFQGNHEKAIKIGYELLPIMNSMEFTGNAKKMVENTNKIIALPNDSVSIDKNMLAEAKLLIEENMELTDNPAVNIEHKQGIIKFFENEKKVFNDEEQEVYKSESLEQELDDLVKLQDSIYQASLNSKYLEIETKYQTEKKEKENLQLKADNAAQALLTQKATSEKWMYLSLLIISLLVIIIIVSYFNNKRKKQAYLSRLEVVKAKQQEQDLIGIELHDHISKKLEAIAIELYNEGNSAMAGETQKIKNEIRTLSKELSTIEFNESEFDEQLITLAAKYQTEKLEIKLRGLNNLDWTSIADPIKHNLFLIIREAVSNTYNYAQANLLIIDFEKKSNTLSLVIKDNGKGFDKENNSDGSGFRNMKLRVHDIKGTIDIKSVVNKGTEIFLQLALA